ncbi:MAG TPA: hypothetical protein VK978_04515, partial [Candidatus Saccharimonadales bacterium]|nr:hypothetical protein [Candidatus Saccharimonadales bacterium]
MKTLKGFVSRSSRIFAALGFGAAILLPAVLSTQSVSAGGLTARKITLASSQPGTVSTDANGTAVPAGQGGNGAQTRHNYAYTFPSTATVGSMLFQYCKTPFVGTTCDTPTGMDASTATIAAQGGFNATEAFVIDTTTSVTSGGYFAGSPCPGGRAHCVTVKRTTAQSEAADAKTIDFGTASGWIKNPTDLATPTFYIRVVVFSDTAYTTQVHDGAVVASIVVDIDITAKVQEKLNFSVAAASVAPGTTCTMLSGT